MAEIKLDPIKPKGKIFIGEELELIQKAERLSAQASFFDIGRPQGLPVVDYTKQFSTPGQLPLQRLTHSLQGSGGGVYIENDGLSASYGIFGAPGSGKTHLLLLLLRQLFSLNKNDPDLKYGALILDPKAALIDDVRSLVAAVGREDDLIVINTDELNEHKESINIIDAALDPYELGYQLVLAAQSAGVATSDPYWILAWSNLFGAATYLLSLENYAVTLKGLMDALLTVETFQDVPERKIQDIARKLRENLKNLPVEEQQDSEQAIIQVENFFRQENENIATIENIIIRAYNPFQRSRYNCYSLEETKEHARHRSSFYDQIIDDGKIVLVSLSPAEPAVAKTLCTLMKCLFQRSVLSRNERVRSGKLKNNQRQVLIACDEYSQVASEVPGQPAGDGDFFSLARQAKCMGLLATQSVNVLQATSLKENWRSVFSNFGAKIFLRLVDNETVEEATKLAGESDWYVTSMGSSRGKDGLSSSTQKDMRERKSLPSSILTQVFEKGDAVIIGSLDGSKKRSSIRFAHVPKDFSVIESAERNAHS